MGKIDYVLRQMLSFALFSFAPFSIDHLEATAEQLSIDPQNRLIIWKTITRPEKTVLKEISTLLPNTHQQGLAMTYHFSGGRFGDNLVAYFHAKWLARLHGIPFLYKPFRFAELLALSDMDQPLTGPYHFTNHVTLCDKNQLASLPASTLVSIPYFPEFKPEFESELLCDQSKFHVDWEDPAFREELIQCLTPKITVETLALPDDCMTVAVHVRRGGAYEPFSVCRKNDPLKFPPDSYYIDEIRRLTEIFKDQILYIHIFTDDLNPYEIAERYENAINNPNLIFSWTDRDQFSNDTEQMLHDFYSMAKFDCLIRSGSNFSIIAGFMGNHRVIITPMHYYFNETDAVIDQIEILTKNKDKNENI